MERWYKYIVIHHTATRCMSAEKMKLSMQRTRVENRKKKRIPTHYIVWCSWDIAQTNPIETMVWATLSDDANANGIHIEVVGDFNSDMVPTNKQYGAVNQIIKWISEKHPNLPIMKHGDFQKKNCPGVNFEMTKLTNFVPLLHKNGAKRPLPFIKGTTVLERSQSFARANWYKFETFQWPWDTYGIKGEVLLCIAWAEWFGKNSWSENNIMNCWNNDRWDRISFDDARKSVVCAADKLKNWLLKNKLYIGDLSFAGNGKIDMQYIYASSNGPREINVRNCLWKIYNKNIDPDFTFRK